MCGLKSSKSSINIFFRQLIRYNFDGGNQKHNLQNNSNIYFAKDDRLLKKILWDDRNFFFKVLHIMVWLTPLASLCKRIPYFNYIQCSVLLYKCHFFHFQVFRDQSFTSFMIKLRQGMNRVFFHFKKISGNVPLSSTYCKMGKCKTISYKSWWRFAFDEVNNWTLTLMWCCISFIKKKNILLFIHSFLVKTRKQFLQKLEI